jgi:lipid II:glycine glycyltransferase (peptidoglycan interpeptide bridge formation enzyme)
MLTDIRNKAIEELYRTPIVQQTAFWSVVKNRLGSHTIAVNFKARKSDLFTQHEDESLIFSDMLIVLQQIDRNHSVAYVPYGPELEPSDEFQGLFLEELSESIRSFLPKNCILIRYDLCWQSWWAKDFDSFDEEGIWKGEPEAKLQEFRFNFNTYNWNFRKAYTNILPSNTIFLDLRQAVEEILHRMKPKTRYNIGLAKRKGVMVREMGLDAINIWYELYRETAHRNRLLINDIKYFKAVLEAKADGTSSPAEVKLLVAEYHGTPLAAMFLVISGHRGSYLYGASSSLHRNLMATYALQWEAICRSKAMGCTEYDMFGISPTPNPDHPMYGLYKFKSGFGGEMYYALGCWDYPLDNQKYQLFRASEINSRGYHLS